MEKRDWCATYISAAQCRCSADTSQLLNESVDIKLPPKEYVFNGQIVDNILDSKLIEQSKFLNNTRP